jgi:hypothetical protein
MVALVAPRRSDYGRASCDARLMSRVIDEAVQCSPSSCCLSSQSSSPERSSTGSRSKSRCSGPCCMPLGLELRDPRSRARSRRHARATAHAHSSLARAARVSGRRKSVVQSSMRLATAETTHEATLRTSLLMRRRSATRFLMSASMYVAAQSEVLQYAVRVQSRRERARAFSAGVVEPEVHFCQHHVVVEGRRKRPHALSADAAAAGVRARERRFSV